MARAWGALDRRSVEYRFALAVLNRAEELRVERMTNAMDNLAAAVQLGVARAFGARV